MKKYIHPGTLVVILVVNVVSGFVFKATGIKETLANVFLFIVLPTVVAGIIMAIYHHQRK